MLFDFSNGRGAGRGTGGPAPRSSTSSLAAWTQLVLRHRRAVLAGWGLVLAAGVAASLLLPARLASSYGVPGTESERAEAVLADRFGERPEGTFTVVFRVRGSFDEGVQDALRARLERAAEVLPDARVGPVRGGFGVVYGDVGTSLGLQRAKGYTERLRAALGDDAGPPALVTGQPAIQHDLDPELAADLRRGEALALPIAVAALALVLGLTVALAVPFAVAVAAIAATLVALGAVAALVAVPSYAINLVELLGLGLAVDYSLLVVSRFREELATTASPEDAVVRTMASAGRAVAFSGAAVAVGLTLLLLVPVPFVRALGLAGLLVPLLAVAAALTLLPALLSVTGARTFAGVRVRRAGRARREPWAVAARLIMRRPLAVLLPTTAILLAAAAPVVSLRLTPGSLASLPPSTEATRGLGALADAFGPGALTPTEIVADAGTRGAARRGEVRGAVARLADRLFHDPEVSLVATGRESPYVSADGRAARVFVVGRHEYGEPESRRLVARIRDTYVPQARFPGETRVRAGGAAPKGVDFLQRAYAFFPWLVAVALGATAIVLAYAFRSLLLPLKAIVLNVLTVAASYGLLVAVFRYGIGADALGVHRAEQIEGWVPIFLFATLFGLSMDYEVFLVSRMREEWDAGRDNVEAVAVGLERTGRLITVAAVVMAAAFAGFVAGGVPGLQQFGLGLAVAVLVDATLVRALLVPSLMAIAGRWNWWLPARLVRPCAPLEVDPSPGGTR